MKVKIINKSKNDLPSYATAGSAGMDIRAHLNKPLTVRPNKTILVPTGLYLELPAGYEAQIRPRSGLAYKHDLIIPNAPGTIDSDYRGQVKVIIRNLGPKAYEIKPGERICQMVIAEYKQVVWDLTEELEETERGANGFGSTGKFKMVEQKPNKELEDIRKKIDDATWEVIEDDLKDLKK